MNLYLKHVIIDCSEEKIKTESYFSTFFNFNFKILTAHFNPQLIAIATKKSPHKIKYKSNVCILERKM